MTQFLNCRGKLLDISTPLVMGILNITPDSFYDGGKFNDETDRKAYVEKMLLHGADLIDIGAVSSRPGASVVNEKEEWQRLLPVLKEMQQWFPQTVISVDTCRSAIARMAIEEGASIVNDITAGSDPVIMDVAAHYHVPYIMMHMQGTPATMQTDPHYEDVTRELLLFFAAKVEQAHAAGISDVIIDPGFGFGKTVEHNFKLLKDLSLFQMLGCPVLAGVSRKSMINKTLHVKAADALNGTTVLNTIALLNGASVLRVHDVKEAMECVTLFKTYSNCK
jgi:dihydropteroate synthase